MTSLTANALAASYAHCTQVAKTQARNFYYSFLTLPAEPRAAMCAIYAFMRYSDDVSDEAASDRSKARELSEWRSQLQACSTPVATPNPSHPNTARRPAPQLHPPST